jgi:hypothetical protein
MAGNVSRSTEATEVFLLFNRRCHFSVQDTQAGLLAHMAIATKKRGAQGQIGIRQNFALLQEARS